MKLPNYKVDLERVKENFRNVFNVPHISLLALFGALQFTITYEEKIPNEKILEVTQNTSLNCKDTIHGLLDLQEENPRALHLNTTAAIREVLESDKCNEGSAFN